MRAVRTLPLLRYSELLLVQIDLCSSFGGRYLGIDYLLAELLLKTYGSDRQKVLEQASGLLDSFLSQLDSYDLLSKPNKALWNQYQGDRGGFQLASMTDPAERRRIKVARFGVEKGLKTKLEVFALFAGLFWPLTDE